MILFNEKKIRKYARVLHRDIGYLFMGLILIYSISGIILVLKDEEKNPAYREIVIEKTVATNLSIEDFEEQWLDNITTHKLTKVYEKDSLYNFYVEGGLGIYNPANGLISYTVYSEREIVKFINEIHYNTGKRFTWLGIMFAVGFIFLGLSGLVMVKGKNGFLKRGIFFVIAGIIVPVLWYLFG